MTLAKMMRKARLNKDITIKIAAKNIGIAASHLHAIERGNKLRPKMYVIRALADFYSLNYDDVCTAAYRIPADVFDKVVRTPTLLNIIRSYKE